MARAGSKWVIAAIAAGSALFAAPAAHAQGQISAGPPNQYLTPDVTIDQGDSVTFVNADAVEHDVLARDKGPDGKPLFRSELVGFAQSAPVEGTEFLVTGAYPFVCSLHPQMEGTITVTSAGQPKPRPGDKTSLKLSVLDSKVSKVRSRGSLRVRVTTNRPATVRMTTRADGSTFARGTVKLAEAGAKTAQLRLTRAGRKLVARRKRIALTVSGTTKNAAGKTTRASAKKTLR